MIIVFTFVQIYIHTYIDTQLNVPFSQKIRFFYQHYDQQKNQAKLVNLFFYGQHMTSATITLYNFIIHEHFTLKKIILSKTGKLFCLQKSILGNQLRQSIFVSVQSNLNLNWSYYNLRRQQLHTLSLSFSFHMYVHKYGSYIFMRMYGYPNTHAYVAYILTCLYFSVCVQLILDNSNSHQFKFLDNSNILREFLGRISGFQ
eukprot:TRINITY_DN7600_c0_g5_i1.p2 TRINITY_DN7600_c0_g5~~TRINITY_DN7600_c0_g5_i1.p2  ORF type:complete len:201 (+),score=-28.78 TRINITY_DN7600_c0_g5_i1:193-795(+)